MKYSVNKASEILGVSISTLRRWEDEGLLIAERTPGGHRRYDSSKLTRFINKKENKRITIAYARVSSNDQKEDLKRQVQNLETYCISNGYQFRTIKDLGSGLNYNKKGLLELIELICSNEIERIVINYKDRLMRFGYELFEEFARYHEVKLEVINLTEDKTYEEELVEDVLSIITIFSSKLYGSRSHKKNELIKKFKENLKQND
ncbi:MAG: IS607 family transposase [Sphaerochaetaceae bacterium]|nr:IS607 family transposase [Sphaerochaetaceae bacterium]